MLSNYITEHKNISNAINIFVVGRVCAFFFSPPSCFDVEITRNVMVTCQVVYVNVSEFNTRYTGNATFTSLTHKQKKLK